MPHGWGGLSDETAIDGRRSKNEAQRNRGNATKPPLDDASVLEDAGSLRRSRPTVAPNASARATSRPGPAVKRPFTPTDHGVAAAPPDTGVCEAMAPGVAPPPHTVTSKWGTPRGRMVMYRTPRRRHRQATAREACPPHRRTANAQPPGGGRHRVARAAARGQ